MNVAGKFRIQNTRWPKPPPCLCFRPIRCIRIQESFGGLHLENSSFKRANFASFAKLRTWTVARAWTDRPNQTQASRFGNRLFCAMVFSSSEHAHQAAKNKWGRRERRREVEIDDDKPAFRGTTRVRPGPSVHQLKPQSIDRPLFCLLINWGFRGTKVATSLVHG